MNIPNYDVDNKTKKKFKQRFDFMPNDTFRMLYVETVEVEKLIYYYTCCYHYCVMMRSFFMPKI